MITMRLTSKHTAAILAFWLTICFSPKGSAQEFSIGVFWPPVWEHTNDQQYQWIKEAHIDFIENVKNAKMFTESHNKKMLDLAHKYGFKVSVADPRIYGTDEEIKAAVQAYKNHPALEGYYIKDEPDSTEFDWAATIYQKLIDLDHDRVPHVNLFPNFVIPSYETNHVERWVQKVGPQHLKYLTFDQYPFMVNGYIRPTYFENLEIVRRVGLKYSVKTSAYLQSVGIIDAYRRPSASELRYNIFTALAYGIKRPVWFTYWTPTDAGKEIFADAIIDPHGRKTDLYVPFSALNRHVKAIGQVLYNLDATEVYHSGEEQPLGTQALPQNYWIKPTSRTDNMIITHFNKGKSGSYVFIVNKSLTVTKSFTFHVDKRYKHITHYEVDSGVIAIRKEPIDSDFSDTFLPGEGRLYYFN
ncbi:hypothetical protein [Sphingobacterium pedocola]|nr:hypothetical protein [Sphingobacterium pedocola]